VTSAEGNHNAASLRVFDQPTEYTLMDAAQTFDQRFVAFVEEVGVSKCVVLHALDERRRSRYGTHAMPRSELRNRAVQRRTAGDVASQPKLATREAVDGRRGRTSLDPISIVAQIRTVRISTVEQRYRSQAVHRSQQFLIALCDQGETSVELL